MHAQPDARGAATTIHRALLSGLLSHVGLRDPAAATTSARAAARFAIFPGSVLSRRQPDVGHGRRARGDVAAVGADGGAHRPGVDRAARRPPRRAACTTSRYWDRKRGSVVAKERVTLYGLPIVEGRKVAYGRIDPVTSRELFIRQRARRARLADAPRVLRRQRQGARGDRGARGPRAPARPPRRRPGPLRLLRRADPRDVVSGAHFDRWWRDARRATPTSSLHARAARRPRGRRRARAARPARRPGARATLELELTYRFEPGAPRRRRDRRTSRCALLRRRALRRLRVARPRAAARALTALLRALPKDLRRAARPGARGRRGRCSSGSSRAAAPLLDDVTRELARAAQRPRAARRPGTCPGSPPHLRMTLPESRAPTTRSLAAGTTSRRCATRSARGCARSSRRPPPGSSARAARPGTIGDAPADDRAARHRAGGARVSGARRRGRRRSGVRVLETPAAQAAAMRAGTRRLLVLRVPSPLRARAGPARQRRAAVAVGRAARQRRARCSTTRWSRRSTRSSPRPAARPGTTRAFARLRDHVAARLAARTTAVGARRWCASSTPRATSAARSTRSAARRSSRRARRRAPARPARLPAGSGRDAGPRGCRDVERYLRAAARRLERLPDAPRPTATGWRRPRARGATRRATPPDARRRTRAWMLEELRVSQFAQGARRPRPVSAKRIRRMLS